MREMRWETLFRIDGIVLMGYYCLPVMICPMINRITVCLKMGISSDFVFKIGNNRGNCYDGGSLHLHLLLSLPSPLVALEGVQAQLIEE